ncbi:hypothetical protein BDW69DRAFT_176668 [Aspergillus filifer]
MSSHHLLTHSRICPELWELIKQIHGLRIQELLVSPHLHLDHTTPSPNPPTSQEQQSRSEHFLETTNPARIVTVGCRYAHACLRGTRPSGFVPSISYILLMQASSKRPDVRR